MNEVICHNGGCAKNAVVRLEIRKYCGVKYVYGVYCFQHGQEMLETAYAPYGKKLVPLTVPFIEGEEDTKDWKY